MSNRDAILVQGIIIRRQKLLRLRYHRMLAYKDHLVANTTVTLATFSLFIHVHDRSNLFDGPAFIQPIKAI